MFYGEIKKFDIADGLGVRVSLFVSGCRNKCKNCFNEVTWDFSYGKEFTLSTVNEIIEALSSDFVAGLTILGGEPFEIENQQAVLDLIKIVREKLPNKTIWIYSGFVYEELIGTIKSRASSSTALEILDNVDVLVDGKFVEELKDLTLHYHGSSNQRVIDMNKTNKCKKIVLYDFGTDCM